MSWLYNFKNKACRYLLQRYLGQFLDENLNVEQLNIELYNGKVTIKNVALRVEALNELLEAQGWPFEFTDGQVGLLCVSVPWNALLNTDSCIEASDVLLCLRPVKRLHETHESMIESMWSSVSSSLQLAEECMRQEEEERYGNPSAAGAAQNTSLACLEKFAETIDNVLNRIQAKFTNVTLKIQYPCHYKLKGVALKIQLDELFYKNETGSEIPEMSSAGNNASEQHLNGIPTFAKHSVQLTGLTVYTQECSVPEDDDEETVGQENIPILKCMGQQDIKIKVKQSEEITGPKIYFDIEFGVVCALFTPRQLHLINHFLQAFSEDDPVMSFNQTSSTELNFQQQQHYINEQQEMYESSLAHGNLNMFCNEPNITINNQHSSFAHATHSNFYRPNYCDSVPSSLSSSTLTSVSHYQRKAPNMDSCAEISNFVVKVASLIVVVLHEDILVESEFNSHQHFCSEHSVKELLRLSQMFFDCMPTLAVDNEISSKSIYCNKNHLFVKLNPIVAEGNENRNKTILQINVTITATRVELCEILEDQVTHLIKFDREKNIFKGFQISPDFSMTFNSRNSTQMKNKSRSNIEIMLEENILEFDITIIDRLGAFFKPTPYKTSKSNGSPTMQTRDNAALNKTEFTINSPVVDAKLRFPIIDFRPLHDPQRKSSWKKKNIRSDYILVHFLDFKLAFCEQRIKINASKIELFYVETVDLQSHLLTAAKYFEKNNIEEFPTIFIDFATTNVDVHTHESDTETTKLPFSSKHHCRESSTAMHSNTTGNEVMEKILLPGDKKEIDEFCESTMANSNIKVKLNFPKVDFFIESKRLYEVIYNRLNFDLFMWEPSCPHITKAPTNDVKSDMMGQSLFNMSMMDSVYISAISQTCPISDTFASTYQTSNKYHHINLEQSDQSDDNQMTDEDQDKDDDISPKKQTSEETKLCNRHHCSVEIKLGKVSGSCFVPVRDNDKHILPQVCGKFLLNLENVRIFLVSGFKNDLNISYLSTQIESGEVYHCGIVPMNTPLWFEHQAQVEDFMQSTLYRIPCGLTKGINVPDVGQADTDMFTIVIEIKKNPSRRIKRVKITAGIHYTTLRYNFASRSSLYWLNQLIDFLDVVDYPIDGYKQYSAVSEMQLHLWDCAIDFRPDNFPYRAVLEMFYFSVCSNIIPTMPCCNLRFVLEECILSLAPYDELSRKKYPCSMISSINNKELVPVLDVGLLDISVRLSDDEKDEFPAFDFRCSIHDVHFRTCYDSGSAFAQLIGYIASNLSGSSDKQSTKDEESLQSSVCSESNLILSDRDQQIAKEIAQKQQERVNKLMAEAVLETHRERQSLDSIQEEPVRGKDELKLFFFPDENTKKFFDRERLQNYAEEEINEACSKINEEPLPIIKAEFGDVNKEEEEDLKAQLLEDFQNISSTEEDYYIIVEEENVCSKTRSGSIDVSDDPLKMVDNHYCLPSSSSIDLLKTPTHFPMPEQRYTLCEMTFTWHLYGGNDFCSIQPATTAASSSSERTNANKAAMSDTYCQGVFYTNDNSRHHQNKKPKDKLTWKSKGGANRNHEVLVEMQFTKVKFSYEKYPRHTIHASRQVLLVNEIEIRDRLQSSEINKFLYNANAKSFGNRRLQNMVTVKATHVRPFPKHCNNQECSLHISLSPLRLHIDQETLEFLTDFFTNFGKSCENDNSADPKSDAEKSSKHAVAIPELPIMTISDDEELELPESVQDLRARRIVSENLSLLIDEQESVDSRPIKDSTVNMESEERSSAPIYFREIIFAPDVRIRFDYHGRRVELSRGPIAGVLLGLGQLQCSEIILRKITYKRGLLGVEKVFNYLCKEWLRDIKRNQLPKILSGVGPTYAFIQLFHGIYDLFWLPIEHYQKDGLIRGLQLGAQSFSARTILAFLEITSRLIHLLQFTAETAFDMVSSGPSIRQSKKNKRRKKRHNRPKDIREGVANAYQILKDGINDSANNLIETTASEHDQKGLTGAVGAVMRQVPQLVVCPAVLATQATTNILGGVKSSLVPEAKLEAKEKWKDNNC